jgi:MFS family permease
MTTGHRRRLMPLLLLESATLLSGTGNGIATVALPWLILERTGSSTAAGLVGAATAIPLLLSSLFAGALVDIIGRRRVAVVSDVTSSVAVAAIPLVDVTVGLTVPVLIALAVLGALFDPVGLAGRETMLPAAGRVAGWQLERVNGVHEAVWGLAFLLGPGIGGVLIGLIGAATTLWVTAAGFALSALLIAAHRWSSGAAGDHGGSVHGVVSSAREGLAFVWRDRLLRSCGLIVTLLVAVYLPIEGLVLPVYFQQLGEPARLGLLIMAMSGGGVVGALAYGALHARLRRRTMFLLAIVGTAALLLGLATLPDYGVMVVLSVGIGLLYGPVNPLLNYAMQTRSPEQMRGRVVGVLTSLGYAVGPLGYLLAGPLIEWLGIRTAFLVLSGSLVLLALLAVALPSLGAFDEPPLYPAAPAEHHRPTAPGPLPLAPAAEPSHPELRHPDESTPKE